MALLARLPAAPAQQPCEVAEWNSGEYTIDYEFGYSVSVSNDFALVGAPGAVRAGLVHVYRYNGSTWVFEQKLEGEIEDGFGSSVSLSGDRALIGSPTDDDQGSWSGSVYLFRRDANGRWVREAKLLASDGETFNRFGQSVSLSGDVALVGALGDNDRGRFSGSAYVFRYDGSTWVQEAKLLASDGAAEDYFGVSVSVSGDWAWVGAHADDNPDPNRDPNWGSAYLFRYNGSTWVQEAKLIASDGGPDDWFGISISRSGDRALVGAFRDDDRGKDSGSAYVFRYDGSTWVQEAKLLASDGAAGDYFGARVSLSSDRALVGAPLDDDRDPNSGSAYIFRYNGSTWVQEAKLTVSDGSAGDRFGLSVSLSGDWALVGAPYDDKKGGRSGSAFLFAVAGEDCNRNGVFDQCDIGQGTSQDRDRNGVPDECQCSGDIDGDGDTDQADLAVLLAEWGCTGGRCEGDLDGDGDTDQADLAILLADWGCGVP